MTTTGEPRDVPPSVIKVAQTGDARALEELVVAIRDRVYRLSLRMVACPADAEDATQEIVIRVITRLSTYRGDAAFTTWVHRIAVNHLLDRSKGTVERMRFDFDTFAADLLDGLAAAPSTAPDAALLEREVQLACTHALLTCLDRDHRIAYILGEIFELDSDAAGYICGISPATHRKRLSRGRARVRQFLTDRCGLVNDRAACHCSKRVDTAIAAGRVDPDALGFTDRTVAVNDDIIRLHDAAALLRSLPPAAVPVSITATVTRLIRNSTVGTV
jgi:RNA polymerase sigma factor (sigma-70 family)